MSDTARAMVIVIRQQVIMDPNSALSASTLSAIVGGSIYTAVCIICLSSRCLEKARCTVAPFSLCLCVILIFSSVQSLDRLGRRGDIRDDSAEILLQTFLQEALMSSSGMGRDVHS